MKTQVDIVNPFAGVQIGSYVSGNQFSPSVITGNITKMAEIQEVQQYISGRSNYVYSDKLNEASLGVSGAYGVSGISKLTSSVSAHAGNATASAEKSIKLSYNISMISGIEYIDFDSLTAEDILNSLKLGPRDLIVDVLDKFNTLREYQQENNLMLFDQNMSLIQDARQYELVQDWLKALNYFYQTYADGMVVGVIWGGFGGVTTDIGRNSYENNWTYGGQADFTYSGTGAAVSVAATYNGNQTDKGTSVDVACSSFSSGECVVSQVNEWFKLVENKAYSELMDLKLLDSAPAQGAVKPPPALPEFMPPKKDPSISQKLSKIGQLGDIEELSIMSGYDKAKKEDSSITPEKFKEKTRQSNSLEKLTDLEHKLKNNELNILLDINNAVSAGRGRFQSIDMTEEHSGFVPLGVWIVNWADIFPWLSTGYLNDISDTTSAELTLKKRCMMQDFCTLSSIYNTFHSSGIKMPGLLDSPDQVANAFSNALNVLKENQDEDDVIRQAFEKLGSDAQGIYEIWNDNGFLRDAELGFGLMFDTDRSISSRVLRSKSTPHPEVVYASEYCSFERTNHHAFAKLMKVFPVIDTKGNVYAFGPALMLLKNTINDEVTFTKSVLTAMRFEFDKANKILKSSTAKLFPIPCSAAQGISDWKGQGVGINLASSKSLSDQLESLRKELSQLNSCSLSSDNWNPSWQYTDPYHLKEMDTSYIGLVNKAANTIFP
ncbi:hypothetical protein OHS39_004870 [Klebsiella aerogenes]|nr:hypothetical protein [Klebsiella aerogenes]